MAIPEGNATRATQSNLTNPQPATPLDCYEGPVLPTVQTRPRRLEINMQSMASGSSLLPDTDVLGM